MILAGILATTTVSAIHSTPAYADCAVIPSQRDIAVIRKVYEVGQRFARFDDSPLPMALYGRPAAWPKERVSRGATAVVSMRVPSAQ